MDSNKKVSVNLSRKGILKFLLISSSVLGVGLASVGVGQDVEARTNKTEVQQRNVSVKKEIKQVNKEDGFFEIVYADNTKGRISILNDHMIHYQIDPAGKFPEYPTPSKKDHTAKITAKKMSEFDQSFFKKASLDKDKDQFSIQAGSIIILLSKENGTLSVTDSSGKVILAETQPIEVTDKKTKQFLTQSSNEFFFGGGTQNGRFTHKGEELKIVNSNNWVDGGVASPAPFYWSTNGYGVVRNTWKPGTYDFGTKDGSIVTASHDENIFDAFYFFNHDAKSLLNDYYELTGSPVLMPEYGFYEAHLNAYNRDYWVEVPEGTGGAVQFEDGKSYKEYQPGDLGGRTGILESLNGEKDNYQFSARAVIDRYKKNDMPLGWFLPNDGYGAGYGQTDSLDGDIQNLKEFTNYANSNGVEVGLWTQSNLHPEDPKNPKKGERDIEKEVKDAGVKALKTDVAWVGSGYSFGLNGVEDAANVFVDQTQGQVRPNIVSLDGWAGTQRHAGIWSGDQTGGEWEYIRFHIPTYIGTGLSGQPNVGSDMDGIFGGNNKDVNIRDYQWKTFTPVQLNMDGWGSNPKTPFAFDDETTKINRAYLKLKSMMMPYNYSLGYESVTGLPMVRAMFLEFPNDSTSYTKDTQYQFMWGKNLLVAPIYDGSNDGENAVRSGILLPDKDQVWIDLFTGEKEQGGRMLNNVKTPLWKLPVYVKDGAIIPMVNPNNNPNEIKRDERIFNIYPSGHSSFELYEDDGISTAYLNGQHATTKISSQAPKSNQKGDALISIQPTKGSYNGFVASKKTQFNVMASTEPSEITTKINDKEIKLKKAKTLEEFEQSSNTYFFNEEYLVNPYLKELGDDSIKQSFVQIKVDAVDTTTAKIDLMLKDFENKGKTNGSNQKIDKDLTIPANAKIDEKATTPTSLTVTWDKVDKAVSYDVERDGVVISNITDTKEIFDGFDFVSKHEFRVRAVSAKGVSEWSDKLTGKTSDDPYKNAVEKVKVAANLPEQPGEELANLTDKDLTSMWHTNWNTGIADPKNGKPLVLSFDLGAIYPLEKISYLPRVAASNGTLTKIKYRVSQDGLKWSDFSEPITWKRNEEFKDIKLEKEKVRFVEIEVLESVGNFGSGREMLFFKEDGAKGYLPGDITNDGVIDENDATSYRNYTGLEKVDSDFEGYVEQGDLNKNGVIDAYDINTVLRQLDGGIKKPSLKAAEGTLSLALATKEDKAYYAPGEELTLKLVGKDLANVNALSARMNFDSNLFELSGQPKVTNATEHMENYSKYRKHSNNVENLYLVLSNKGDKALLNGSNDLLSFNLKIKENIAKSELEKIKLTLDQGLLVSQALGQTEFEKSELVLEPKDNNEVSKDKLVALVKKAQNLKPSEGMSWTPESKTTFEEALKAAEKVLANEKATQKEINQVLSGLEQAITDLKEVETEEKVNTTKLEEAISAAKVLKPSDGKRWTEESETSFKTALLNAEKALQHSETTQEEVDQLLAKLVEAADKLVEVSLEVDKQVLKEVIDAAKALQPSENTTWTKESETNLRVELVEAEKIYGKKDATQKEVDQIIEKLEDAASKLEETTEEVTKTNLDQLVNEVNTLKPAEGHVWLPETEKNLKDSLTNATEVLQNANASQYEVDLMIEKLQKAIDELVEVKIEIKREVLNNLIKEAEKVKPEVGFEFTAESKKALEQELKNAIEVYQTTDASQAEVDEAGKRLEQAIKDLKQNKKQIDKTKLKEAIANAKAVKPKEGQQFTKESEAHLKEVIGQAEVVLKDEQATLESVTKMVESVNEAIKHLESEVMPTKVDKAKLEKAIKEADAILEKQSAEYTKDSLGKLKNAVSAAKIIVVKAEVSQVELDRAEKAIQSAVKGLEKESTTTTTEEPTTTSNDHSGETDDKGNSENTNHSGGNGGGQNIKPNSGGGATTPAGKSLLPKTGEQASVWLGALGSISLLGAGLLSWFRKKN